MSEAAVRAPRPNGRSRWLKGLLIASLAINALAIGLVLRAIWHNRGAGMAGFALEARLPGFVGTLPRERREILRNSGLVDLPRQLRPLRGDLRRARMEAARLFQADPFDRAAFVAAQAAAQEAELKLRRVVQELLPDIAERMTPDERRRFAHWRNPGRGGPGREPRGDGAPNEPRQPAPP